MKRQISIKQAFEETVKKWEYFSQACFKKLEAEGDEIYKEIPDNNLPTFSLWDSIRKYKNNCPYCELFYDADEQEKHPLSLIYNPRICTSCPLNTPTFNCLMEDSPFDKWSMKGTSSNAKKVLKAVLKTKPKFDTT